MRKAGVNFINVLYKHLYECHFGSLESGVERTFEQKMGAKNVDDIDGRVISQIP
jgi:hypothetical protein